MKVNADLLICDNLTYKICSETLAVHYIASKNVLFFSCFVLPKHGQPAARENVLKYRFSRSFKELMFSMIGQVRTGEYLYESTSPLDTLCPWPKKM